MVAPTFTHTERGRRMNGLLTATPRLNRGFLIVATALLGTGTAWAQTPEAPAAPAAVAQADAPPPPPPPAPPPPPPAAPPAAVEATPKPPTAAEAMPATRPDVLPPIQVGAWTRVGSVFQGSDPSKLNDWRMDNAYVELHAGGKIHQKV